MSAPRIFLLKNSVTSQTCTELDNIYCSEAFQVFASSRRRFCFEKGSQVAVKVHKMGIQWKLDLAELDLAKKLDLANNLGTPEFLLSKIHSI